jgi:hypothetical protein
MAVTVSIMVSNADANAGGTDADIRILSMCRDSDRNSGGR